MFFTVRPLHALPDVEGPREAVLARLPRLGDPRRGREILEREVHQQVVVEGVHEVSGGLDPHGRIHRVDVVVVPNREDDLVAPIARFGVFLTVLLGEGAAA
jgi:hypothetical protein